MKQKIFLIHPTGNANVRAALDGLNNCHILFAFQTTIALFFNKFSFFIPKYIHRKLKKRYYSNKYKSITFTWPWFEIGRLLSNKLRLKKLILHESGIFCIDNVYQTLDLYSSKKINSQNNINAIYAYEDGAINSFQLAKLKKILCLYELPIGYWKSMRRLLVEEKEKRPEWASTLTGFRDSDKKLFRKDEELRLADHIFVASSFTKKTLEEYEGSLAPISVIPYGFPPVCDDRKYDKIDNRKLKLLFVGGLSQRKGIANVFEAVSFLKDKVELTVVGRKSVEDCQALNEALNIHRWIPSLSHDEVLKLMREHDLLVFPSLFEGFGLVITEAMSQGTPVITTDRTVGPDLIQNGTNGWLVNAGDTDALRTKIEDILKQPSQIEIVGKAAMETARHRPWSIYGQELATTIQKILA